LKGSDFCRHHDGRPITPDELPRLNWYLRLLDTVRELAARRGHRLPALEDEPEKNWTMSLGGRRVPAAAAVIFHPERLIVAVGESVYRQWLEFHIEFSGPTSLRVGQQVTMKDIATWATEGKRIHARLRPPLDELPFLAFVTMGKSDLSFLWAPENFPHVDGLPDLRALTMNPERWPELARAESAAGLAEGTRPPEPADKLPAVLSSLPYDPPLVTCEEPRVLLESIARKREWEPTQDGAGRVFRPRPHSHEVWLTIPNAPEEWGPREMSAKLDAILEAWGLNAAFLAAITVSALAEGTRQHSAAVASGAVAPVVDVLTDELLKGMGKRPESRQERNESRRWVRRRLLEISGALVVGARRGKYRLPGSREEVDTYREERLFHLIDAETTWEGSQPSFDGSGVPLRLRIHGGGLFREIARNPQMIQYIGNLRTLAEIPAGKAGGQWARAMGLAFAQFIREEAAKARPRQTFTRRELLTRLPPDPTAEEILKSDRPGRVIDFWRDAKKFLVDAGWWLDFKEPPKPAARYGWGEGWLDQEVEPSPGPILTPPLPELAARAEAARKRKRRPRKGASGIPNP